MSRKELGGGVAGLISNRACTTKYTTSCRLSQTTWQRSLQSSYCNRRTAWRNACGRLDLNLLREIMSRARSYTEPSLARCPGQIAGRGCNVSRRWWQCTGASGKPGHITCVQYCIKLNRISLDCHASKQTSSTQKLYPEDVKERTATVEQYTYMLHWPIIILPIQKGTRPFSPFPTTLTAYRYESALRK